MANERRLIDANALIDWLSKHTGFRSNCEDCTDIDCLDCIIENAIKNAPEVNAAEVPCKIGDFVWAIRSFRGKKHPQRGIASDMYFTKNMKLQIVVKYVARGEWGKTVFATDKEAYAAIGERRADG